MAVDKLVDSTQLNSDLTSVANAIRTKGGTSASLAFPAGFVSAVEAIETGGGGSGIHKATYQFTPASTAYTHNVSIAEDTSKILFVHFYDVDATYPTNGTTYEGFKLGPALAQYSEVASSYQWQLYRTSNNGSSGYNFYGTAVAFSTQQITISSNPQLTSGHLITVEVFYTD